MEPVHTGDSEAIFKEKHRCLKRKLKYLIYVSNTSIQGVVTYQLEQKTD